MSFSPAACRLPDLAGRIPWKADESYTASLDWATLCYPASGEVSCVPLYQGLDSRPMATPRPPRGLSWVPFLVYLASFLLVTSFILFEVLDIDDSDFPASPGP